MRILNYAVLVALVLGVGCGKGESVRNPPAEEENVGRGKSEEEKRLEEKLKAQIEKYENIMKEAREIVGDGGLGPIILNPSKELTLEEKVVGTYEVKEDEYTYRAVILNNGIWEAYINGEINAEHQWKISKEGELHIEIEDIGTGILRINKDGSITDIAKIIDGRRNDFPKERQKTYIFIK